MSRPKGAVFNFKTKNLVYVLFRESKKNDGTRVIEKKAERMYRYDPRDFPTWEIYGIFEDLAPEREYKSRDWTLKQEAWAKEGIPEGKCVANQFRKIGEKVLYRTATRWEQCVCRRRYLEGLKAIKEKAAELIALGIDRKAALQAARKCSCAH